MLARSSVAARTSGMVLRSSRRHHQVRRESAQEIPGHLSPRLLVRGSRRALAGLSHILLFWIGHGVHTFRVDNPHTKPFAFWEWVIGEVHARHPGIIFLAEAF